MFACACSLNKILEYNLLAETKRDNPGTQKQEPVRFFNVASNEAVLPLIVIPREVVKLILEHGVSPLGTVTWMQIIINAGCLLDHCRCACCRG